MSFWDDLRHGFRIIGRNPGFSVVIIAALAIGLGANTTVFTLVNAVLFKGLPFDDGHRIMFVTSNNLSKGRERIGVSRPDLMDWRAQSRSFQGLAGSEQFDANLTDGTGTPERYVGARITTNSFSLLGAKPVLGRDFISGDENPGAPPVVIIGYGIWKDRFGQDPKVLGRTVRLSEVQATIIGVMPAGFKFPVNQDVWMPLVETADLAKRDRRSLMTFGRLAGGVELAEARAEMDLIAKRLEKEYKTTNEGVGIVVRSFNDEFNGGAIRVIFLALLGAVGFVLLIVCANVANLLLSRSVARSREISVRVALGASRWRVVRQLLVESLVLSVIGGTLGLFLAVWGVKAFALAVANVGKPYWIDFSMDYVVFGYLAAVALVTTVLFGLAPTVAISRADVSGSLKEGGRGTAGGGRTQWLSGSLVVIELTLALVLLTGAGLMIRSFLNIYGMTSFVPQPEKVLTMRIQLSDPRYLPPEARRVFFERLHPRLRSLPGVEAAAFASHLPLGGSWGWQFEIDGKPQQDGKWPSVSGLVAGPDYFRAIGVNLARGRTFNDADGIPGREVVVINQRFAAKYLSGEDPLGRRIRIHREKPDAWMTVIGVAPDVRQNDPTRAEIDPLLYVPLRQDPGRFMAVVVRTRVAPESLSDAARREVQGVDANLPVFRVQSLVEHFYSQRWAFRVFGTLFAIFAGIALVLAAVGIYGVLAYSVSQRTQEIGVRMALGASSGHVLALILRRGLVQLGIGLVLGLAAAFGVTRAIRTLLVGVTPFRPVHVRDGRGVVDRRRSRRLPLTGPAGPARRSRRRVEI